MGASVTLGSAGSAPRKPTERLENMNSILVSGSKAPPGHWPAPSPVGEEIVASAVFNFTDFLRGDGGIVENLVDVVIKVEARA